MTYFFAFILFLSAITGTSGFYPATVIKESFTTPDAAFDIYRPRGESTKVLMLIHGMIDKGKQDATVVNWARTLAKAKFTVVVPEIKGLKNSQMGPHEVKEVQAAMRRMIEMNPGRRKGVMTFCFGNPLVVCSLDDPFLRDNIDFIVSWGGFADFRSLMKHNLTGYYETDGKTIYTAIDEDVRNRYMHQVYWFEHLPAARREKLITAVETLKPEGIDPRDRVLYTFLVNRKLKEFDLNYGKLPASVKAWVDFMTVRERMRKLENKIVFVHNYYDAIVPVQETMKLYSACGSPDKRLHLPAAFEHYPIQNLNLSIITHVGVTRLFKGYLQYFKVALDLLSA